MKNFGDLAIGYYYIIQESENANLDLVFTVMETQNALLLEYQEEEQNLRWVRKTDSLYDIVDQLTDEQANTFEALFDEEEKDDDENVDFDDEDEDPNENIRTINELAKAIQLLERRLELDTDDDDDWDDEDFDDDGDDDDDSDDDGDDDKIIRMSRN